MSEKIAKILNYLFHPILMPTYGSILLLNINHLLFQLPYKAKLLIILIIFFLTFILPLITIYFMKVNGILKSLIMLQKEDRYLPYLVIIIFYYLTYKILFRIPLLLPILNNFIIGATFIVVLAMLINFKWKISSHMLGIGGLTGTFIGLMFKLQLDIRFLIVILILLSGTIGFARLKSQAHTPAQVYTGFALGAIIMGFLFSF